MIVYCGSRLPDGGARVVWLSNSARGELPLRLDLRNHSPTGHEWGYGGSGPAQLALDLLSHASGDDEGSQRAYQKFKAQVIARLPREMGWVLTEEAIRAWLAGYLRGEVVPIGPMLLPSHPLSAYTAHG
jgi:hypothetical protein